MNFWEKVDMICEYKDIPRKELAYKADFALSCISNGIARNSMPFADVALRIAKVLGVSVEYLLEKSSLDIKDNGLNTNSLSNNTNLSESDVTEMISEKEKLFYKYESVLHDLDKISVPQQKSLFTYIHAISNLDSDEGKASVSE